MRLRKNGQPDRRFGPHPHRITFRNHSPERLARYLAHQRPDPNHVRHLREGIDLFRRMLEAREPRDEYSRQEPE